MKHKPQVGLPDPNETGRLAKKMIEVGTEFVRTYVPESAHDEAIAGLTDLLLLAAEVGGAGLLMALTKSPDEVERILYPERHERN